MKTEKLLEKYFDGQTTCEEERALRRFFASPLGQRVLRAPQVVREF